MLQTRVLPVRRVGTAVRDFFPPPRWLTVPLFVLIGLAVYVLIEVPSPRTRARQAWEREQRELTRQQLQATQALVEEVRRLRETLEVRR